MKEELRRIKTAYNYKLNHAMAEEMEDNGQCNKGWQYRTRKKEDNTETRYRHTWYPGNKKESQVQEDSPSQHRQLKYK